MKIKPLLFALAVVTALPSFAYATKSNGGENGGIGPTDGKNSLSNAFFKDSEEEVLFIDFDAIGDRIVAINILLDTKLMMEDDVRDLPADVIYEINLSILRDGQYTIELVTDQSIKIQKIIVID